MAKNKKASKLSKAEQKYVIHRLLGFAKRFIPLFIIAFIFAAASTIMSHYIPVLVGEGEIGGGHADLQHGGLLS